MEDYGYSLPSESVFYNVPVHLNHSNNNNNNFINQNNENINRHNYNDSYNQQNREQVFDHTIHKVDNSTAKFNNIIHVQSDTNSDHYTTKQSTRDFASNVISIPFKGKSTTLSLRYK